MAQTTMSYGMGDAVPSSTSPRSSGGRELEDIFARMRAARAIGLTSLKDGGFHVFPTAVALERVWPSRLSHEPGVFEAGANWVDVHLRVGGAEGPRSLWDYEIAGRFCVLVTEDASTEPTHAIWSIRDRAGFLVDDPTTLPWFDQLPKSVRAPHLKGMAFAVALKRMQRDGAAATSELLDSQRGLVVSVERRYRRLIAAETASIDREDLVQIGLERLLEVAITRYAVPAAKRPDGAAWSKVVLREISNAIKTEIATVTGVSVEFRQLISWMRSTPSDRVAPAADVALRMACAAGVTRLIEQRVAANRHEGEATLIAMLDDGRAIYIENGPGASARKSLARAHGLFVISPRSSLAEIERAQQHDDAPFPSLDMEVSAATGATLGQRLLVHDELEYDAVINTAWIGDLFSRRGLSPIEAAVWARRTGVLDPAGRSEELPEIAARLGMSGRSEARAALRRARRKLEGVSHDLVDVA
jgi:hypothetical protein